MKQRVGLGLLVILIAGCVFGTEGVLSLMRTRNINVTLDVQDASGASLSAPTADANVQTPTPIPGTPDPNKVTTVSLPPNGNLVIRVKWSYQIGPTFPQTTVNTEVRESATNKIVAAKQFVIDCGSASLECKGEKPIDLAYNVQYGSGTRADWPLGDYVVTVTRSYGDLKAFTLLTEHVIVSG